MNLDHSQSELISAVSPRALKMYAEGLGWKPVNGVTGLLMALHSPADPVRQIIIPMNPSFYDFSERAADAIERLASFEDRPFNDVLSHILLPPADIISFREVSSESESGDISLEHASRVIEGATKSFLAVAHSVVRPQSYHPSLRRSEAKKFLSQCRMSTGKGSFVLNVACLLNLQPSMVGAEEPPFARRVTSLFLDTLEALDRATLTGDGDVVSDPDRTPGISANLCEALANLRPNGDRSYVSVSAAWSRALLPHNRLASKEIRLSKEIFDLAEVLGPRMRSPREPEKSTYIAYVNELRGSSTPADPMPSGEVRLSLYVQDEELRAKTELNVRDYEIALAAHAKRLPVAFSGILHRASRDNVVSDVEEFQIVKLEKTNF